MGDNKLSKLLPQIVLCVIMAVALSYTVQGSFRVSDTLHGNIALGLALCALLQCILFAGVVNAAAKAASYLGWLAVSIAICVVAVFAAGDSNPVADVEGNAFCAMVVLCVVNVLVFSLTRKHATCVLLFGAGCFTCGFVQFLYTTNMLVAAVVFAACSAMMIALRGYLDTKLTMINAPAGSLANKIALIGVLVPLGACLLACVVVIGIIMPLNPPHTTIKLFTTYLAYEEINVKTGVELDDSADKTVTSSTIDESLPLRTSTDKKTDDYAEQKIENSSANSQKTKDYLSKQYSDVDLSAGFEGLQAIALNKSIPWVLIILGILLVIVLLAFVPPRLVRVMRLAKIKQAPKDKQVEMLYSFFLSRFGKLGFAKPETLSPVQYANLFRERIFPYAGAQDACTFDHLTALLVWQRFAGIQPDEKDLECMYALYEEFYRKCRSELGFASYNIRHTTL